MTGLWPVLEVVALQPRSLGQVDLEAFTRLSVAAGHLGGGMAELALDMGFVDGSRRGKSGAQGVAGEQRQASGFGQIGAHTGFHGAGLDEPRHLGIDEAVCADIAVGLAHTAEHRSLGDASEFQPAFQRMDRAGRLGRAAPDFNEAPAGLALDGEKGARLQDLDPAAAVLGLRRPAIQARNLGAAQGPGKTDEQDGAVTVAAQVLRQGRDHRQNVLGIERLLLNRRPAMGAADPGHDIENMPVLAGQRRAKGPVHSGQRGQTPFDGRRGSGFQARASGRSGEKETDDLRIGQAAVKTLATTPALIELPVGGIGFLGVSAGARRCIVAGGFREAFERGGGQGYWNLVYCRDEKLSAWLRWIGIICRCRHHGFTAISPKPPKLRI
jgi:hypothetical protein